MDAKGESSQTAKPQDIQPQDIKPQIDVNMNDLMEEELQNRFNHPWSKLDRGSKLNRIHFFIKKEKVTNNLNDKQELKLKELLLRVFGSNDFNKNSEIEYSIEDAEII